MRHLLISLLFVLPASLCNAQATPVKPAEPTAIGVVYRINPATQELQKLPDEQFSEGRGSQDPRQLFILVTGAQSPFRIPAAEKIAFVFNTGNPEKVSLYRFDQKKKKRQFLEVKFNITGGGAIIKGLPVEVSKYGDSSYELVPGTPLAPGEYGIAIGDSLYTFGVD